MKNHDISPRPPGWRGATEAETYHEKTRKQRGKFIKQHGKAGKDTEKTGESLFLLGFLIFQIMSLWDTTMFPLPLAVNLAGRALGLALIAAKILIFGGYSPLQMIGFVILGGCTAVTMFTAKYVHAFVWIILLAGSKDVSFKKILQVYLAVSAAGIAVAFAASALGVIENLRYVTEGRGTRNSFGFNYTTAFSAHLFFLFLIAFYLKGERLRVCDCLAVVIAAALVYRFCNARLDSAEMIMMAVLFWVGNGIEGHTYHGNRKGGTGRRWHISGRFRRLWRRIWKKTGPLLVPSCMAVSLILTCAYGAGNGAPSGTIREINEFSGGRLGMGWQAMKEYGIHLFGRDVSMNGFGDTTKKPSEYFIVDNTYINLLMRGGILYAAAFLLLYARACRRNRHDLYFFYAIALLSLQGLFTFYPLYPAYNPLLLAAFAECVRGPEREPGILELATAIEPESVIPRTKKLCGSRFLDESGGYRLKLKRRSSVEAE